MSVAVDKASIGKSVIWGGGVSPLQSSYGKIMMWFFLVSDALTFGGFLISLWTTRFSSASWPDPNKVFSSFPFMGHTYLPLLFVSLMTFILILSSVTMVLAVDAGKRMQNGEVAKWLSWTIVGGLAFLGCQAWEWNHLFHQGAWWGANPFLNADGTQGSVMFTDYFFTITGFHGFHVFTGVLFNFIILLNVWGGTYKKRGYYEMVEKVGLYWHFVDLVWVFVFTCYYLL